MKRPVADGSPGTPTSFEIGAGLKKTSAHRLSLLSVKKLPDDVLWVRYRVK